MQVATYVPEDCRPVKVILTDQNLNQKQSRSRLKLEPEGDTKLTRKSQSSKDSHDQCHHPEGFYVEAIPFTIHAIPTVPTMSFLHTLPYNKIELKKKFSLLPVQ
jgi:hypothetical protein